MYFKKGLFISLLLGISIVANAQPEKALSKVIAFYTAKNDQAHISFVHEANMWFAGDAAKNSFQYDTTNNWDNLNPGFLANYQVVIFLDSRPEDPKQRMAFEQYMKNGGSWLGFHFAAFALSPSAYPQNWDWYHNEFLGSGQYKGNTWRPTTAILKLETPKHAIAQNLPAKFTASPNEWYSWEKDLRKNPDIDIIYSIDPASFPLGTGPKQHEIWHAGYYPVVWTNKNYRMVYINMGHNDIDYEHNSKKELSFTFNNKDQCAVILECLKWLRRKKD